MTAVIAGIPGRAEAVAIDTLATAVTVIWTHFLRTVDAPPMTAAMAGPVDAETVVVAVVWADRHRAVLARPPTVANTFRSTAVTMIAA